MEVVFLSTSLSGIIEGVQLFVQRKMSVECLKGIQQWEDLGIDERVTLNRMLMKQGGRLWGRFFCFGACGNAGLGCTQDLTRMQIRKAYLENNCNHLE